MKTNIKRPLLLAALGVAICADFIQLGLFPVFFEGGLSFVDGFFDLIICIILTCLVGWHFAFLPSFLIKLVPLAAEAPTWTLAVLFATRQYWNKTNKIPDPDTVNQKPRVTVQEKAPPKILPEN
jgi:hypothetical protein